MPEPVLQTADIIRMAKQRLLNVLPATFAIETLTSTNPDDYSVLAAEGIALVGTGRVGYEVPTDPAQRRTLALRVFIGARGLYPDDDQRAAIGYTEDVVRALGGYEMRMDGVFPVTWYTIGYEPMFESAASPGVFWCRADFEGWDLSPRKR